MSPPGKDVFKLYDFVSFKKRAENTNFSSLNSVCKPDPFLKGHDIVRKNVLSIHMHVKP